MMTGREKMTTMKTMRTCRKIPPGREDPRKGPSENPRPKRSKKPFQDKRKKNSQAEKTRI